MIPKDGPVDVAAVYTELGEPPTADGYDVAHICSNEHGRINKWAKYKPLRGGTFEDIDEDYRASVNQGLAPVLLPVGALTTTEANEWQYLAPTESDWKRINDFAGYNGQAAPPLRLQANEIEWDRGICDIEDFKIYPFYRIDGSHYFGPTGNVQISLSELPFGLSGTFAGCYWALVWIYDSNGNRHVCNSECKLGDSISIGNTPAIYPGRWANFKSKLNSMADGDTLTLIPIVNPVSARGDYNGDAQTAAKVYRFPMGELLTIRKTYTPPFTYLSQGVGRIYVGTTREGNLYRSSGSVGDSFVYRQSNKTHKLCIAITIKNDRTTELAFSGSDFWLSLPNKNILVRCNMFKEGDDGGFVVSLSVAANSTKTFYVCADIDWGDMEIAFPFVDPSISGGAITIQSQPIRVKYKSVTQSVGTDTDDIGYMYYYKIL